MPKATHLECSICKSRYASDAANNLCTCGGPLLVRYDLDAIRSRWLRRDVASGPATMWRYAPILPASASSIVTLREGSTPLIPTNPLGQRIGSDALRDKDGYLNPTASLTAHGLTRPASIC